MENPISHEEMDEKDVVYGDSPPPQEGPWVLFMPRGLAEAMVTLGNVLDVKTWGELKSALPPAMCNDIWDIMQDSEEFEDVEGEPPAETPFSVDSIYGYAERDWPYVWATAYQSDWIPGEIIDKYGDVFSGMTMGSAVLFEEEKLDQIIAAFAKLGYKCVEDRGLVASANWAQW
ncbi:MAG TPA: hypothetical protein VLQ48_08890 [Chloroflexia bacterium]|nr:hypothetical protein [Chloroflexia bacterium]